MKILIVEDDPIVGRVYRSRLEKDGFVVGVAITGDEGLQRLGEFKPDAVLLDVMLPNMNGIDLLKKIRSMPEHEDLPVYMLTNAYVTTTIRAATSAGATGVFNKAATTPREIIETLRAHVAGTEARPARTESPAPPTVPAAAPAATVRAAQPPMNSPAVPIASAALSATAATRRLAVAEMRKCLQEIRKAAQDAAQPHLEQLSRKLASHATAEGTASASCVARLAIAAQALVQEMAQRPKTLGPSTLKATAQALDCLDEIGAPEIPPDLAENPPIHVLVAEDEPLSRRAIVTALERARITVTAVDDSTAALERSAAQTFDLILLDINMPGMGGLALCSELRESGRNASTPIVFVTSETDLQARAQSTLRGATDFLAKPFSFSELVLNTLTYVLRSRAEEARQRVHRNGAAFRLPAHPGAEGLN